MVKFFNRIQSSLKKTREGVFGKLNRIFTAKRKIDDDLLEEIEEILIAGDVGVDTSLDIIDKLKARVRSEKYETSDELELLIRDEIAQILLDHEQPEHKGLEVILVVGVNGTGKTNSIAKLEKYHINTGKTVLLAAADTFRAAAIDQLSIWADRAGCDIIKHQDGADPSAVVFDAVNAAQARNVDYLIIDTAGRLHTKSNLMAELSKISRVIQKKIPVGPHQVILVLDASTGQNAINQAKEFKQSANVDSIFLTKLDGTAKGGVIAAIAGQYPQTPPALRFVGVGEGLEDLRPFDAREFVDALFD